jgi:rubrerythrin
MDYTFPELNTIGALFRFADALEHAAIDVLDKAAATASGDTRDALTRLAAKRRRRAEELERARREKLNETVLEPLMDMPRDPYVPALPASLDDLGPGALVALAADIESTSTLFYADAVARAGRVLAEVRRLFDRFAKESAKNEEALRKLAL